MWLLFCQNHYRRAFLLCLICTFTQVHAEDRLGIFHSLKGTIDAHRGLLKRQFKNYRKLETAKVRSLKKYKINKSYLRSLILHSPQRFYGLLKEHESCQVFDLIVNNLLRSEPELSSIIALSNEEYGNFIVDKQEFQDIVFKRDCPQEHQKIQFFKANALASFLNSLNFQTPTTQSECHQVFSDWKKNQYLPNFCSLMEVKEVRKQLIAQRAQLSSTDVDGLRKVTQLLEDNSRLKRAIPQSTSTYLNNLCSSIDNKEKFCKLYISPHVWHKVLLGEKPDYLMKYRCRDFGRNLNLSACRQTLLKDPRACHLKGSENFGALTPKEDCNLQSFLLNQSRLVTKYRDCPAFVGNSSIININRVYSHFYPEKGHEPSDSCQNISMINFAQMNADYKNDDAWPMQICYFNKIEDKKICKSYIPGETDEPSSETRVVADIIKKLRPSPDDLKCKKANTKEFKPNRLKYRVGCFIVSDFVDCTLDKCDKKIYFESKEVKGIEFKGKSNIHYFDDSFVNPRYSQLKMLEKEFKIRKKDLSNFTVLRTFLGQNSKNIVHGIGCLELLSPRLFSSRGFNQCTPEAFIIDDILEIKGKKFVIARLAIDDVHSPRLIWWHNIFHSVRKYQELHPAKPWTLYGAYRDK